MSKYILAIVIALVIGALVFLGSLFHDPEPAIPERLQSTIDSLRLTRPIDQRALDSLAELGIAARVAAEQAKLAANVAKDSATQRGLRADSLAAYAAALGSNAEAWRAAYEERTTEVHALKLANSNLERAVDSLEARALFDAERIARLTQRNSVLEDTNTELQLAIERATTCEIVGFVPCPSRTHLAILNLVTLTVAVAGR